MVAIHNGLLGLSVRQLVQLDVTAASGIVLTPLQPLAERTAHCWELMNRMKNAMTEIAQVYNII